MGNYRRLLLLQPHFNPPSPLLPSVSVQFPDEFQISEISPRDLLHLSCQKSASGTNLSWRLSYNFRDEQHFTDDGDDRYDGFRFGGASKKRIWWLDDDEEGDDDFDSWQVGGSRNEFPVFKVISALGWMVPAIAVSMLVGTDQNALVMALAVPLVQTAVSVVVDKLWGRITYDSPGTKSFWTKTRRRPFNGGGSNRAQTRERKEEEVESRTGNGYQSWVSKSDSKGGMRFGGWDELDREGSEGPSSGQNRSRKAEYGSTKQGNRVRMRRRRRVRDRPLLIRVLVSVFPFMSSWSSFLL
ncbi:hypothetical protein LINGRAHAP2_LOCUS22499 [Linum grandiflorum]